MVWEVVQKMKKQAENLKCIMILKMTYWSRKKKEVGKLINYLTMFVLMVWAVFKVIFKLFFK